jgi:hypothetical protein
VVVFGFARGLVPLRNQLRKASKPLDKPKTTTHEPQCSHNSCHKSVQRWCFLTRPAACSEVVHVRASFVAACLLRVTVVYLVVRSSATRSSCWQHASSYQATVGSLVCWFDVLQVVVVFDICSIQI